MKLAIRPGKYVVAVSGGADSVVLLDILSSQLKSQNEIQPTRLIVAHLDHGVRPDSEQDRILVAKLAKEYGYPFVYQAVSLGIDASEDVARTARYNFLRKVKESSGATAIITGHHSDDAVETAVFNILRGTGRNGVMLQEYSDDIWRPLISYTKDDLRQYAKDKKLTWREDSTNQDTRYSRNYIRNNLLKKCTDSERTTLYQKIQTIRQLNTEIDALLVNIFHLQPKSYVLERRLFAGLPHIVAKEFLVYWLRKNRIYGFDSKTIERLTVATKTGLPGRRLDVVDGHSILLSVKTASLQ